MWAETIDVARRAPDSRQAMRNMLAFLNLLRLIEANRLEPDYAGLSDEELAAQRRQAVLNMLQEDPQLLAAAAQRAGFTVVPN
jgi:hypothetical protein